MYSTARKPARAAASRRSMNGSSWNRKERLAENLGMMLTA